jgi:hypothetical protein
MKKLVYFMNTWPILRPNGLFNGNLVYFVVIWYIFPHFGMLKQEKSSNHDQNVATGEIYLLEDQNIRLGQQAVRQVSGKVVLD